MPYPRLADNKHLSPNLWTGFTRSQGPNLPPKSARQSLLAKLGSSKWIIKFAEQIWAGAPNLEFPNLERPQILVANLATEFEHTNHKVVIRWRFASDSDCGSGCGSGLRLRWFFISHGGNHWLCIKEIRHYREVFRRPRQKKLVSKSRPPDFFVKSASRASRV